MEKLQEYELVMKPMLGRKRILRINRTRYEFYSSDKNFTIQQEGIRFELPAQKGKAYCYCLEYINDHFIFTAITDRPFKINGVNSFKSYVEVGDTLEFSYSQLSLKKRKSSEILEPYSFMKKILKDSSGDFFIQVPLGIDYESLFKYKKK